MNRSLGTLTLDLIARTGGFESGMGKAARIADSKTREMERQAKARAKAIESAFDDLGKKIAAAWGALKVVESIKGAADLADQLGKLSQRTGMAVSDLSALTYAAKLNDATLDDLGNGLKGLSNKMLDAAKGSGESADTFKALGISVTDSVGKLRPVGDVLLDIADKFSRMEDGAGKSALANKLMEESGLRLIPTLNQGRDGLAQMRTEAEALGVVMGDDLARQSAEFNDNLSRMQALGQQLAADIGNTVIPAINDLAKEFLDARKAGLSFMEALVGIGLSDPTKSPAEHIARVTKEIEDLRAAQAKPWWRQSTNEFFGADKAIPYLEKQLAYWKLQAEGKAAADFVGPPSTLKNKAPAPKLTSTPKVPRKTAPKFEDPLTDAARTYGSTLDALTKNQREAETSALNLTTSQRELLAVMSSPDWLLMPETWRIAIAQQGEYAINAEKVAADQEKLNALLDATPTAQLEKQRATMEYLAQAFEKGRISAEQFSEAANASLGNVAPAGDDAKNTFLDLATVANDAARNMASAFAGFFSGQKTGIKDMLVSFLAATAQMIAQSAILKAIQAGMKYFGIPVTANAKGGVYDSPSLAAYEGSIVSRPTLFKFANGGQLGLMGEAGAEAILPLKRGKDGKLGVTAAGGGSGDVNVSIVVNDNGSRSEDGKGDRQQGAKELGRLIEARVVQVITEQKRPGGLLYA